ncbi:MAG TPA: pectinesterase family protein, partial [Polyangiaceae bacterium]|nr:pectinesterase family protein [Polyangiaceae bacterium]
MAKMRWYFAQRLGWISCALALGACGSDAGDGAVSQPDGGAAGTHGAGRAGGGGTVGRAGAGGTSGGSAATGGARPSSGGALATNGGAPAGGADTSTSGGTSAAGGRGTVAGTGGRDLGAGGMANVGGPGGGTSAGRGGTSTGGGPMGGRGGTSGTNGGGSAGAAMVGLPDGVTALFPAPNATNLCKDPSLRITFAKPPTFGKSGSVQVLDAAGKVAASVDLGAQNVTDTIGGQSFTLERRAYIDGNTAVLYLPSKGLAYGQTYSVNVPAGAIVPAGGGSFSLSGSAWRFSTAAAAPSNLASVSVALDGSGAFCSLQGALDALPSSGSASSTVTLAPGHYYEVVYFKNKSNLTIHGQSRSDTVILGTNNNDLNPSTKTRALVGADGAQNLIVENLTIQNLTPQDGSQAEALRLESCTHCSVRDADIRSLQDTLLWSGTLYAKNCFIAGNVDFIWGTGAAYFDHCEIKTVGRSGYVVQARNAASGYGYVFVDSKLTADAGITGSVLARIDVSAYPASHVAYVGCAMGSHITRAGWLVTGGSPTSALRFWEYQSTDLDGKPLDVSGRLAGSTQISAAQAATMRDPSAVLGG